MKKLLILLFFLIISCNYNRNYQINKRTPPIVVIAIDTTEDAVVFRDGDNKTFTIYNNPTTKAITSSLVVGDTLRLSEENKIIVNKF